MSNVNQFFMGGNAVGLSSLPLGSVLETPPSTGVPAGFKALSSSLVLSKADYPALYDVIGDVPIFDAATPWENPANTSGMNGSYGVRAMGEKNGHYLAGNAYGAIYHATSPLGSWSILTNTIANQFIEDLFWFKGYWFATLNDNSVFRQAAPNGEPVTGAWTNINIDTEGRRNLVHVDDDYVFLAGYHFIRVAAADNLSDFAYINPFGSNARTCVKMDDGIYVMIDQSGRVISSSTPLDMASYTDHGLLPTNWRHYPALMHKTIDGRIFIHHLNSSFYSVATSPDGEWETHEYVTGLSYRPAPGYHAKRIEEIAGYGVFHMYGSNALGFFNYETGENTFVDSGYYHIPVLGGGDLVRYGAANDYRKLTLFSHDTDTDFLIHAVTPTNASLKPIVKVS